MTLYDSLITTTGAAPPRIILYSREGVGKSTFAVRAKALMIDCELGLGAIKGARRTPYLQTWQEIKEWIFEIGASPPPRCKVAALDTGDWAVRRIEEDVTLVTDKRQEAAMRDLTNTIGSAHGGFFKAREIVKNIVYKQLIPGLNAIVNQGMAVIVLAHAANVKMTSPEGIETWMAGPDFPEYISAALREWADCIFYARSVNGERSMLTQGTNVIIAKNRYGLPPVMPLSWDVFMQAKAEWEASTKKEDKANGAV